MHTCELLSKQILHGFSSLLVWVQMCNGGLLNLEQTVTNYSKPTILGRKSTPILCVPFLSLVYTAENLSSRRRNVLKFC